MLNTALCGLFHHLGAGHIQIYDQRLALMVVTVTLRSALGII